ncbi:hypothetical protein PLICRDRAFT_194509 [Plicaturopsis crispa FD-325 SS-3]|nr:hypothetical protein PLICRDRAFT_194509 [Plicaturopsis crispa FD-325 SS-3]
MLIAISEHLPDLESLWFVNAIFQVDHPIPDFVQCVGQVLPRFTKLEWLMLPCVDRVHTSEVPYPVLDQQFETVVEWGDKCATLAAIFFPNGVRWSLLFNRLWMPMSTHGPCTGWFQDKVSRRHPAFLNTAETILGDPSRVKFGTTLSTKGKKSLLVLAREALDRKEEARKGERRF